MKDGVQIGILNAAVLEDAFSLDSFQLKAGLFQHPAGCKIGGEGFRIDPDQLISAKGFFTHLLNRLGHDPLSPEGLPEPISQLCGSAVYILPKKDTDAPHRFIVHHDRTAKLRFAFLLHAIPDKPQSIFARIRIGERISQPSRYLFIIRVLCHGLHMCL